MGSSLGSSARNTPKPSRSGILTSRNTRSVGTVLGVCPAAPPWRLPPPPVTPGCVPHSRTRPRRAPGSSSTPTTRKSAPPHHRLHVVGQPHAHSHALVGDVAVDVHRSR